MFGVMRLILEDEVESISGDEDFFSVARTMPFVAAVTVSPCPRSGEGDCTRL